MPRKASSAAKAPKSRPAKAPQKRAAKAPVIACGACGKKLRAAARFCDGCGIAVGASAAATPPEAPAPASGLVEMRPVTVLFADMKGFTALSEKLDPDDVHHVIQSVFALTDAAIQEHGGHIEKHIGDAVMAVFGVPQAREDDPARATRAAFRFQRDVAELALDLERRGFPPVALRVGINTGRVALGAVGQDGVAETSVWGDTVNVAARLQTACPSGGVLLSHETYRHVRGLFEVEPQPPVHVKGKSLPLITYLVKAEKDEHSYIGTREVLGQEIDMIGRDVELALLMDVYERSVEKRRAGIVTIIGSPGMGKSRLLHEYLKRIEASPRRVFLMRARSTHETSREPFHLLASMLKASAGIQERQSQAQARELLRSYLESRLSPRPAPRPGEARDDHSLASKGAWSDSYPEEGAHFLGELLGIPFPGSRHVESVHGDPLQVRQRGSLALERLLERGARTAPLVIELEDIQWADTASLELFEHVVGVLADLPFLVIAAARPEIEEHHAPWLRPAPNRTVIRLKPLPEAESRQLVEHLLSDAVGIPPDLVEDIARRSVGTPYFAEEMVKNLADLDVLSRAGSGFTFNPGALTAMQMPPTVEGVLQARLDRLPPDAQVVARIAAVFGRNFWDCAIEEILASPSCRELLGAAPGPDRVPALIDVLRVREITRLAPVSSFPPCQEHAFVHDLMRDVAYMSMVKRVRSRLHLLVAGWLEGHAGDRSREWLATIAGHFESGGDAAAAGRYYFQAGQAAADLYANDQALALFEKAVDVGEIEGVSAARERLACATIRERTGDWERAVLDLRLAEEAARDDPGLHVRILCTWAHIETNRGAFDTGADLAGSALERARASGDRRGEAAALQGLAYVLGRRGDSERALAHRQDALAIHQELDDEHGIATCLTAIASTHLNAGRLDEAAELWDRALAIFRRLGDQSQIGGVLHARALGYMNQGMYPAALALFEESLDLRRRTGNRPFAAWNLHNMASIRLAQGDRRLASSLNDESIAICRAVGNRPGVAYGLTMRALIAEADGRLQDARTGQRESLEIFDAVGERPMVASAHIRLASMAREEGSAAEALERLAAAEQVLLAGDHEDEVDLLGARADVLEQVGRIEDAWEGAVMAVERSTTPLQRGWSLLREARLELLLRRAGDATTNASHVRDLSQGIDARTLSLAVEALWHRVGGGAGRAPGAILADALALGDVRTSGAVALHVGEALLHRSRAAGGRPAEPDDLHLLRALTRTLVDRYLRLRAGNIAALLGAPDALEDAQAQLAIIEAGVPADDREPFLAHPFYKPLLDARV